MFIRNKISAFWREIRIVIKFLSQIWCIYKDIADFDIYIYIYIFDIFIYEKM